MQRLVLALTGAAFAILNLGTQVQAADGKAIFEENCAGCHEGGGAPRLGDHDAWQPRIDKGMDALYANAINGVGGMPPKGGNADLSDEEVKAAVDYIASTAK